MTSFDTPSPDRNASSVDPAGISTQPVTSIDISAYMPEADSEPTA